MNKRNGFIAIVVLLVALVGIFSYKIFGSKPMEENTIRIGVLRHESSLPIFLADEFGYFAEKNVSVKLVDLPPGDHMPALISKRVDILSPTSFPVLFGIMLKNPNLLHAVFPGAEIADGPTVYGFVVSSKSNALTINDLKNGTVMAINPYTKMNVITIFTMSKMPKELWPSVKVAGREAALNALASGQVDAAIMDQPALAVALSTGEFKLLEANPRAKYIGSPYWSGSGAVLREMWKKKRPNLIKVMAAVDKAIENIDKDPEGAHQVLAQRMGIDKTIASQMGGYYFPKSTDTVDRKGIKATVKALVEAKLLEEPIAMDSFFPQNLYNAQ